MNQKHISYQKLFVVFFKHEGHIKLTFLAVYLSQLPHGCSRGCPQCILYYPVIMRECRTFYLTIQPTIYQFPTRAASHKFDTAAIISVLHYGIVLSALVSYVILTCTSNEFEEIGRSWVLWLGKKRGITKDIRGYI